MRIILSLREVSVKHSLTRILIHSQMFVLALPEGIKLFVMYSDHMNIVRFNGTINRKVLYRMKEHDFWTHDLQELCALKNIFQTRFAFTECNFKIR
jgi:hypothetical protein